MKVFIVIVFVLSLFSSSVFAWNIATVGNAENVDIVIDNNGILHRVYEYNGNIYYSNSDTNTETLVSDGFKPSIAVGNDNKPQIAFIKNNNLYYAKKTTSWNIVDSDINVNSVDIAVKSNNMPVFAVSGNYDGDGYNELAYITYDGTDFYATIFADGFYDSDARYGNYVSTPSIALDSNDKYYIAFMSENWGGQASWSDKNIALISDSSNGNDGSPSYSWGSGLNINKNSIVADNGNIYITYSVDGNVKFARPYPWNNITIASGGNSAIDAKNNRIGIVYEHNGNIYYTENTGSGFSVPEIVDSGSKPVVALGSTVIDYISNNELVESSLNFNSGSGCVDNDNDGFCSDDDCNDYNPNSWRIGYFWGDSDNDGYYSVIEGAFPDGTIPVCYGLNIPQGLITSTLGPDCNDNDPYLTSNCEIPEFTSIGVVLAAVSVLGLLFLRRK
ncbi:MAG: hypothetical protein QXL18_03055 [Candidatus Woesearchaeota archaeon]